MEASLAVGSSPPILVPGSLCARFILDPYLSMSVLTVTCPSSFFPGSTCLLSAWSNSCTHSAGSVLKGTTFPRLQTPAPLHTDDLTVSWKEVPYFLSFSFPPC